MAMNNRVLSIEIGNSFTKICEMDYKVKKPKVYKVLTVETPEGIVVMGNEGRGVTEAVARTVTRKLFIPPWPADRRGSESLNVAMATGIVCSEFRRRTHSEAKR